MGGKLTLAKKDSDSSSVDKAQGRCNQYENIDDEVLATNQEKCNAARGLHHAEEVVSQKEHPIVEHLRNRTNAEVQASNEASIKTSTNSPNTHRFHPYDEITEEHLSKNQTKKNKKMQGNSDEKISKKTKEVNAEPELVSYKNSAEACITQTSSTDGITKLSEQSNVAGALTHLLPKENIKSNKEDKSSKKDNIQEKGGKKKKGKEKNTLHNADVKPNGSGDNTKKPVRLHTYDEISEDDLAMNRAARDTASTGLCLNPSNDNSKLQPRRHPYDEINDELTFNRKAIQDKKNRNKSNENLQKETELRRSVTESQEGVEYSNVLPVKAHVPSREKAEFQDDTLTDLYAVPQKKQPKQKNPNTDLTYVEVEFNPAHSKQEVKRSISPTTYTNVVAKDGRLAIAES